MSVTIFGIIWIVLLIWTLFKNPKWIFSLLIFSCIFQGAAVFNLSNNGISPMLLTELFFIIRFNKFLLPENGKVILPGRKFHLLLVFALLSLLLTLITPSLFSGIKVYEPGLGIDTNVIIGGSPLKFSNGNIFQITLLLINILTTIIIFRLNSFELCVSGARAFIFSILFVCFVGIWQYLNSIVGVYFPESFFLSNNGYALIGASTIDNDQIRISSTFSEASYAGAFLASSFWALYTIKSKKGSVLLILAFIVMILNLSATAFVSFLIGGVFCLYLEQSKLFKFFIIGTFFILSFYILMGNDLFLLDMLNEKQTSFSGINRHVSDLFSLALFKRTYGLGVGLGSHRASSFIFNLLALVGVVSVLLFFYLYYQIKWLTNENKNNSLILLILPGITCRMAFIRNFILVLLIGQFSAIPDLTFSVFWMGLFFMYSIPYNNDSKIMY